jgi:hypothetical protein
MTEADMRIRSLGKQRSNAILREKPPTATQNLANLPWLTFPKESQRLRTIVVACNKIIHDPKAPKHTQEFFRGLQAYTVALVRRQEVKKK